MTLDSDRIKAFARGYEDAWNSGDPSKVASCYAENGIIVINRGTPWEGRSGIRDMAAGFYGDVDDMRVILDDLRVAGDHAIFVWTFTGRHAETGNTLNVKGWEEWDLNDDCQIQASRGWFDADEYARQVAGG